MAEILILQNFTVDNWAWDETLGAYGALTERMVPLTAGENYRLMCNGASYEPSTAQDVSAFLGAPAVAVGGLDAIGLPGNGSACIIGDLTSLNANMFVHTGSPYGSPPGAYTFSLYHVTEADEAPPDSIALKDRKGTTVIYPDIDTVRLMRADGETVDFVPAADVPELIDWTNVNLDLSGGDQLVQASDGYALKTVNIKKPVTLAPGNIAEGIEIAGIIGTLKAGGGGGVTNLVFASGSFTADSTGAYVVTHGLGVVPDIAFVCVGKDITLSSLNLLSAVAYSSKMYEVCNNLKGTIVHQNGVGSSTSTIEDPVDTAFDIGYIRAADESTMRVGGKALYKLQPSADYTWFAIGGLTKKEEE